MLFAPTLKVATWVLIRYESFFIFFHMWDVLIFISPPNEGANCERRCIIKALR